MTTTNDVKMPGTPKPWMNTVMRLALRVPGTRSALGGMFAVLTVEGAKTGRRYRIPVQYFALDDHYLVLSQRHRRWWKNLAKRPAVEFLVRGTTIRCIAEVVEGDAARASIARCLEQNPRVAKFYSVAVDSDGEVDPAGVDTLAERVVVILIGDRA